MNVHKCADFLDYGVMTSGQMTMTNVNKTLEINIRF